MADAPAPVGNQPNQGQVQQGQQGQQGQQDHGTNLDDMTSGPIKRDTKSGGLFPSLRFDVGG